MNRKHLDDETKKMLLSSIKPKIPQYPPSRVPGTHVLLAGSSKDNRRGNPDNFSISGPGGISSRPRSEGVTYGISHKGSSRSRYPNYLPEMKARRQLIFQREEINRKEALNTHQINVKSLLTDVAAKNGLYGRGASQVLGPRPATSDGTSESEFKQQNSKAGHPLYIPPDIITRNFPKMLLSLYRSPDEIVDNWDIGSPTIQLENMRVGNGIGPRPSQLPSRESSHAILLSMRGRHRKRPSSAGSSSSKGRKK